MSTGEDEASPRNGRLRPRKSISTCTPNPQLRAGQKAESRRDKVRPTRSSTSSKLSPVKRDDLSAKCDPANPPLFLCPYCDSTFHARQTASKHARRIHLSTSKQDNFIKCLYCNHTDVDSNAIIKHMVDSHPNQYFACLDCHTRFASTTELAEHKLNVCDKQKLPYRCKLRQQSSTRIRKNPKKLMKKNAGESNENAEYTEDISFNGIVISCELKPSESHDADIEDKITTNLILPSAKTSLGSAGMDKSAVIVLDDLQWKKRIPPNFSFHNTDADQILSRLGVVHRSPRVGESKKDLIKIMEEPNEKFEKCFDTNFYSRVAKNVQENLANFVDGTLNFNPNKDFTSKTRKSKAIVLINTAEGFPILLAQEQCSRHLFDGFLPRALAPKHKWKWDSAENDKSLMMLLDQTKRDSHVNSCIITLISGLDIWTQLRMKSKFDEIFKTTPTAKKTEKQNKIGTELKEILESRVIPTRLLPVVQVKKTPVDEEAGLELPSYLGLSASRSECSQQPAVLSGEWVRPRCFVCCACGEQTGDARALTHHLATQHPNAQVQHYEIVGETLLSADILKHLYVPLSQMPNRTRPPRGFRDCTKCKKSVTLEDLHQHMLDCAGDTPAVRRKCRYRPFGVRRRRPRLPDNIIRKKMRKDMRARRRQKSHMRPRPRNRAEVGDAETIRKMIADLPAKRNRITPANLLRPKRTILKVKKQVRLRASEDTNQRPRKCLRKTNKSTTEKEDKKLNDTDNSSTIDEDDQPLKISATRISTRSGNGKQPLRRTITISKNKKKKPNTKKENKMQWPSNNYDHQATNGTPMGHLPNNYPDYLRQPHLFQNIRLSDVCPQRYFFTNQLNADSERLNPRTLREMRRSKIREEEERVIVTGSVHVAQRLDVTQRHDVTNTLDVAQRIEVAQRLEAAQRLDVPEAIEDIERIEESSADGSEKIDVTKLDSEDERIDVTSSCSSNGRQCSGVDDNSTQRGMGHPTDPREGGHQNNNVSQMPNLPLRHSIASLSYATEEADSLTPYHRSYILPSPRNQPFVHGSLERKDFENEVTVEKVDKPPLSNNNDVKNYLDLKNIPVSQDLSQRLPFAHALDAAQSALYHNLDPTELQASVGKIPLPIRSATLDGFISPDVPQHLLLNEIQESNDTIEDSSNSKDTTESDTQKTDTEISRIKTNKVRKVLNIENCIAKIRTKKGLPIDKRDSEEHDSRKLETHSQNTKKKTVVPAPEILAAQISQAKIPTAATLEAQVAAAHIPVGQVPAAEMPAVQVPAVEIPAMEISAVAVPAAQVSAQKVPVAEVWALEEPSKVLARDLPLRTPKSESLFKTTPTTKNNEKMKNNDESNEGCIKKQSSKTQVKNPVNEQSPAECQVSHEKKTPLPNDNIPLTQTQREAKPELSITKSTKPLDSKNIIVSTLNEIYPAKAPPTISEFMVCLSKLSTFWQINKTLPSSPNRTLVKSTLQTLKDLNIQCVTEAIPTIQKKMSGHSDEVGLQILQHYCYYYLYQKFNRQLPENNELNNEMCQAQAFVAGLYSVPTSINTVAPQTATRRAENTEKVVEENTSRQGNNSPTSKKIKRRPIKKPVVTNQNTRSTRKQTMQSKQTVSSKVQASVSPREVAYESGTPAVFNASHLKPALSDPQHLRIPALPSPYPPNIHARRDSYMRISNSSDTCSNVYETREALRTSPTDAVAEKMQQQLIINNLRRQSFEAYAQSELANYNNYALQSYMENQKEYERFMNARTEYERTMKYSEKPHSGPENLPKTSGSEHFRRDERLYPLPTMSHIDSDVHDNLHGVSKAGSSNQVAKKNTQERYDNRKTSYDSGSKQDTVNLDSSEENKPKKAERLDVCAYGIACHESHEATRLCNFNILMKQSETNTLENDPPRLKQRRSTEVYARPPVPSMDLLKKSEYTTDLRLNENNAIPDNCSRLYHEPMPPFEPPSMTKLPLTRDPNLANLSEDAPLDLSCVSRKEHTFDILQASDLSINMCIKDRQSDDTSMIPRHNIELLRTHSHHMILPEYSHRFESVDDFSHQENPAMLLKNADNHKNLYLCQENLHQLPQQYPALLSTADAQKGESDDNPFLVTSSNNSLQSGYKEILKTKSGSNINTSWSSVNEYRSPDDKSIDYADNLGNPEDVSRLSVEVSSKKRLEDNNYVPANLEVSKDYHINLGQQLSSQKSPATKDSVQDQHSIGPITSQKLGDSDANQSEQDAETARKIAMLPEELVKVLGTIPKDHRNQLLNILPQYVSIPVANVETDTKNISSKEIMKNASVTWPETKENTVVSNEPNKVYINTSMSSSIVVPEKRHSPSHSRGSLNAGESQSTSLLAPSYVPTLSPHSGFGTNEARHSVSQTTYSLEKASENSDVDISNHPLLNKVEAVSIGIPTNLAIPIQQSAFTSVIKQKASNEQTASLRAVRIKTTLAKKTFHEDNKLLMNYSYNSTTNTTDESSITSNSMIHDNTIPDLKQDEEHVHKKQINSDTYLSGAPTKETSFILDNNQTTNSNKVKEQENTPFQNVKPKENEIVLDSISEINNRTTDSNIEKKVLQPPMKSPQNKEIENIIESIPIKSPPDSHSLNNETDRVFEKDQNSYKNNVSGVLINTNSDLEQLTSVSAEIKVLKHDVALDSMIVQMDKTNKAKIDTEEINEEDSDDDIALAVIKQKHIYSPAVHGKDSTREKAKLKQSKFIEKRNRHRKITKRYKKVCSKKTSSRSKLSVSRVNSVTHMNHERDLDAITKKSDDTSKINDLDNAKVNVCDNQYKIDAKELRLHVFPESSESTNNNSLTDKNDSIERNIALMKGIKENQNYTDTITNSADDSNIHDMEIMNDKSSRKKELNNLSFHARKPVTDAMKYTSDFDLCSEISEVNVIPLRRSRRGKSMYVDSSYLVDDDRNKDTKVTPLTMKRLILSRVEKDKKRISESNAIDIEIPIVTVPNEELEIPTAKRGKQTKRKKSPNSRKFNQKKTRPSSTCDIDENYTIKGDVQLEDHSLILRELHDAENKKLENESCKNIVKCRENESSMCTCSTASKKKETETSSDNVIEACAPSKHVERKLNVSNLSEINFTKSNKSKGKNKSQSDFDSDDDKVLLETKQRSTNLINESDDKNTPIDQDINSEKSKKHSNNREPTPQTSEEIVDCHTKYSEKNAETRKTCYGKLLSRKKTRSSVAMKSRINVLEKYDPYDIEYDEMLEITKPMDNNTKSEVSPLATDDERDVLDIKQRLVDDSIDSKALTNRDINRKKIEKQDIIREPTYELDKITDDSAANSNVSVEIRKTCYSKPMSSKKPQSSSATIKCSPRMGTSEQRDPYDFDELSDTAKPIAKKKGKGSQTSKLTEHKSINNYDSYGLPARSSKQMSSITVPELSREYDSDSSKSDVPLQKYVEDKESELKNKYCNSRFGKSDEKSEKAPEQKDDIQQTLAITENEYPDEGPLIDKERVSTDANYTVETQSHAIAECFESNMMLPEENENKQRQSTKQKKSRRATTTNVDAVSNELEKLRSEKGWMEFFSCEKTRRKSNVLATKKISETFHLISNDTDDYRGYKEKSNENKKKIDVEFTLEACEESKPMLSEETTAALKPVISDDKNLGVVSEANETDDAQKMDDSDLDSLTAQAIMDSEEVRNLENDLFTGLREAAKANAARNCFISYQNTSTEKIAQKHDDENDPVSRVENSHPVEHIPGPVKKCTKVKAEKPPGYKAKMYPDVEEFDMFEDKFDKIKRKRRSQAVAAKQQVTVETSTSSKSRKQTEKKKIAKTSKKSHQSGLVPTKGALKGFECIKISIPTQDLNLPSNVSPPRQSKKRRKTSTKRRKESSDSESSYSDFEEGDKPLSIKDIYEFKDSEDAELFDLRPSTVMDRFRSMHSKNKSKHKDKEKSKEDRVKSRDKHKKKKHSFSADVSLESQKTGDNVKDTNKNLPQGPWFTEKNERPDSEKNDIPPGNFSKLSSADIVDFPSLTPSDDEEYCRITKKGNRSEKLRNNDEDRVIKDTDKAVAGTSAMIIDEDNKGKSREKHRNKKQLTTLGPKMENKKVCANIDKSLNREQRQKSDRAEAGAKNFNREEKHSNLNKTDTVASLVSDDENYSTTAKKGNQSEKSRNNDAADVRNVAHDVVAGTSGFVPDRMDESDYESEMSSPEGDFIFYTSNDVNCACPSENESDESDTEKGCGRLNCLNKNKNADKNTAIGNIFKNNAVRCEKQEVKDPKVNIHKPDLDRLFDSLLETERKPNDTSVSKNTLSELEESSLDFSFLDKLPFPIEKDQDVAKSKKGDQKKNDIVSNTDESSKSKSRNQQAQPTRRHESKNKTQEEHIPSKSDYTSSLCRLESDLKQYYYDALKEYPDLLPGETASTCAQVDNKIDESEAEPGNESAATKYLKGVTPSEAANMKIYTMVSAQGTQTDKSSPPETSSSKHEDSVKNEGESDSGIVSSRRVRLEKYDACEIAKKPISTKSVQTETDTKDKGEKCFDYEGRSDSPAFDQMSADEAGVARQRARRKCTVGKQNVLAEHWSSESEVEFEWSTAAGAPKKRRRKRDMGKRACGRDAGKGRPRGPKIRARAPRHCWSSSDEAEAGPPPQHGWIVGDSHKKLVTMLAHAKGRKRTHADRRAD